MALLFTETSICSTECSTSAELKADGWHVTGRDGLFTRSQAISAVLVAHHHARKYGFTNAHVHKGKHLPTKHD